MRLVLPGLLCVGLAACETWYRIVDAYPQTAPPPPFPMRGREPVDARAVLGCWRMPGPGRSQPWIFALDSAPAIKRLPSRTVPGARAARVYRDALGDIYWWVTPRNTVELAMDDGLHGTVYEFVPRDGRLIGREDGWTDIVGVYRKPSRVIAERAPCPADGAGPSARG